ncbi:MAG: 2-amino-4-hydroxy-6-hydroxymethyldihydropteridine diphosphokinase [Flavobacteriales bacterium]|nr:2-amino-4-hydroxy-6-hydroxymethyldihydropteridine diphosphokinase [Flavobacteriales bacterium]MCB9204739.1 2-amino-4-hydroxy-6-hydroxymethyldihydropteridine diphosphokinase [Flavobacteriales bacterium]
MQFVLLTGADLGNRAETLRKAAELVSEHGCTILASSKMIESAPWGFESETVFLNQALLIETELPPTALLEMLIQIELTLGRTRNGQQWSSRTIDIDILCGEKLIHHSEQLVIPHPHLHEREFALEPLCQLVPNWKHPLLGKSYAELLNEVKTRSAAV